MEDSDWSTDELVELILAGNDLSAQAALDLEKTLLRDPDNVRTRMKLIGYYEVRQWDSRKYLKKRQEHIIWSIEHLHSDPIMARSFGIALRSQDPKFYDKMRGLWMQQITANPLSTQTLVNAALHIQFSDKPEAAKLLAKAKALWPEDEEVLRLERIIQKQPP